MHKIQLMLAVLMFAVSIPTSAFAAPPEPQEGVTVVQDSQTGARLGCANRGRSTLVEVWAATEGPNWYYTRPLGSKVKPVKTPSSGITSPISEDNCTQDGVPKPAPTVKVEVGNLLGCAIQKAGNGHEDRWVRVWEAKGKSGRFYALPTNYSLYPGAPLEELGKDDFQSPPTLDGCPSVGPSIAESKRLSPTAGAPTPSAPARPAAADQTTLVEDSFHLALPDGGIWLFLLADICLVVLIFFLVALLAVANTVQMLQKKQTITLASWTKELLRMFHILRAPQPTVRTRQVSRPTTQVVHPPSHLMRQAPAPSPTAVVSQAPTQHPLPPAQVAPVAPVPAPAPVSVVQTASTVRAACSPAVDPSNGGQPAEPEVIPPVAPAPAPTPTSPVNQPVQDAAAEEPNPELVPFVASVAALNGRPLTQELCRQLADSATMADLLTAVYEDGDTVSEETLAAVFADCQMNPEQIRDLQDHLADRGVLNADMTVHEKTYILLTQEEYADAGTVEEPETVEADDEESPVTLEEESAEVEEPTAQIPFLTSAEEANVPLHIVDVFSRDGVINDGIYAYLLRAGWPTSIPGSSLDFEGGTKRSKEHPETRPWKVTADRLVGDFTRNSGGRIGTLELAEEVVNLLKESGVLDANNFVTLAGWTSLYWCFEQSGLQQQNKYWYLTLTPAQRTDLEALVSQKQHSSSTPPRAASAPPIAVDDDDEFIDVVEDNEPEEDSQE